jgi:hypothetical protein
MQYPLNIRFKVLALASQISVTDATGSEQFYVKQKMFKLKENIEIYKDSTKTQLLFTVKADKVIDFSPTFTLADAGGNPLGTIKRQGARSIWRASYDLQLATGQVAHVREASPWIKVFDAILGELPIIGLFMGYMLHPKYIIESSSAPLAVLEKRPAFLEGKYALENAGMVSVDEQSQQRLAALLMMVVLLERTRG